jgi:hypothetical protein
MALGERTGRSRKLLVHADELGRGDRVVEVSNSAS